MASPLHLLEVIMGLAVYVHIPFCRQKCYYCDFPSYPLAGLNVAAYLAALGEEMSRYKEELSGTQVSSIFIGGGTPTLLNLEQLEKLFENLRENLVVEDGAEITLEGNPGTVDMAKLKLLRQLGVNRLSLGVQSFDARILQSLGRIHSGQQAVEAFTLAREAGFENINLDLMHGIPGQSMESWQASLQTAANLAPEHLALYGLIVEEGTPFGRKYEAGELVLPEEELREEMASWAAAYLQTQGFAHYEISNYARPGRECRHNKVYWHNLPYLGFGAGAASYYGGVRGSNEPGVDKYIELVRDGKSAEVESEITNIQQEMSETMFLGLRLLEGVSREGFKQRFLIDMNEIYGPQIERLVEKGLLLDTGEAIKLSVKGLWLANEVFCEFV